jgi:hypothetical protein
MADFKLYQINEQLEYLLDQIHHIAENNEGEIPENYAIQLDELNFQKEKKILDIAKYIKTLKAKSEAIKNEMDILNKRYKSYTNYNFHLRQYLKMSIPSGSKYEDSTVKISWRKSDSVHIFDMDSIPEKFIETKKYAHLMDIKKEIKAGKMVPGASLSNNNNITIR